MAPDVFVVQIFYWTGNRKMVGVFTTFEDAKTAMLINAPKITIEQSHLFSGDWELWSFAHEWSDFANKAVIERIPLSGGA